ncbi:hypothetical protein H0G77_11065, partial [[Pasteurella] aerogenes]|nr:hypothetical protein [[Pasteurella] aerogenes]
MTVATSGTTTADDFGTLVYTYVDAKGDTQTITPNADGTINVPAGVTEFKITTPVTADNSTEGDET